MSHQMPSNQIQCFSMNTLVPLFTLALVKCSPTIRTTFVYYIGILPFKTHSQHCLSIQMASWDLHVCHSVYYHACAIYCCEQNLYILPCLCYCCGQDLYSRLCVVGSRSLNHRLMPPRWATSAHDNFSRLYCTAEVYMSKPCT